MYKLGILCSGSLGLSTLSELYNNYEVGFILTDSNSAGIMEFASINDIPIFHGNPRGGVGYNFIKDIPVDVILSINYLFLIEEDIINHPDQLTFNIHGSLLPKYRGRTPHVWAIINGESETGITAHIIDKNCDTGSILEQIRVPILPYDTGANILDKYARLYTPLIQKVLTNLKNGTLKSAEQDEEQASYYEKRTPVDGIINWNWNNEQIYNWVRAQASPYPGAFTYYNHSKVIIDKVSIVESKDLNQNFKPGTIIQTEPKPIVQTGYGLLQLEVIREENCTFETGNRFNDED